MSGDLRGGQSARSKNGQGVGQPPPLSRNQPSCGKLFSSQALETAMECVGTDVKSWWRTRLETVFLVNYTGRPQISNPGAGKQHKCISLRGSCHTEEPDHFCFSEKEKSPHPSNYYEIIIKRRQRKRHLIHGNLCYSYVPPKEMTGKAG